MALPKRIITIAYAGLKKIYLAAGYTDLRRGIDGLATMIRFQLDPYDKNTLFLFCGKKTDRIKGLLWEGDGFLLLYKRLDNGAFSWPRSVEEALEISSEQYAMLMQGQHMVLKNRTTRFFKENMHRICGWQYRASGIMGKYPGCSVLLSTVIMTKGKQPPGSRNCVNLVQWDSLRKGVPAMAIKYTEEQLNSVNKSMLILLYLSTENSVNRSLKTRSL